ncbi:dipeptide epimerase [Membranicola marinus]|uniref:Dipeptide epimerase n=1 Tax=Membranihabitans marinus TaxID=1227546 RepID=A0A953L5K3_9BACT|nr:dipeptide epimerase [Membranihabitans marinus]MBY5956682.1 dipeptide epimerase [Membranihabitans marinus]
MTITEVTYRRMEFELSEPYYIAYESIHSTVNFILQIKTNASIIGYGCAVPDAEVTGEIPDQVEHTLQNTIIPFLSGKDPFSYARILYDLKKLLGDESSAMAMVDMALHDLIAKKSRVPLYRFLGGYRNSIPTSITIGILSIEDTIERAHDFIDQNFSILKIKGGNNLDEDIEKMIKLREEFPEVILRFDGNQGYSLEDSIAFVNATERVGIEIYEQPVHINSSKTLGKVTKGVDIPVMADESLKTLSDAFYLAQNEHVDMVNIKLMKVGGILEGMHINSVAKSAGLEAMVGCIDECALGIAAGLHFALARPNIRYADLDGHLDLIDDPFQGLFKLEKGILYPSDHPGLGKIDPSIFN